jgi:hypothetical protein
LAWMYRDEEQAAKTIQEAIDEIEATDSDRAAAIVAAAFLEDQLTTAIQSRMHRDKKIFERMCQSGGALGNFSTKIDIGFMIGIYRKEILQELHTIRRIRNEFAHKMGIKTFDVQRIKSWTQNLTLIERIEWTISNGMTKENLTQLFPKTGSMTPRERYISTCQLLIAMLGVLPDDKPLRTEV